MDNSYSEVRVCENSIRQPNAQFNSYKDEIEESILNCGVMTFLENN